MKNPITTERKSDRELVVTRTFDAPARMVFEAWTNAALFARWWVPKSHPITLLECDVDARVGGKYRLLFAAGDAKMEFFGRYLEVVPQKRLVWTNEEAGGDGAITTVTFEEKDGKTTLTMSDLHPTKDALDEALGNGSCEGVSETFQQLEDLLASQKS